MIGRCVQSAVVYRDEHRAGRPYVVSAVVRESGADRRYHWEVDESRALEFRDCRDAVVQTAAIIAAVDGCAGWAYFEPEPSTPFIPRRPQVRNPWRWQ